MKMIRFNKFICDEKAQGEWNGIYMILVIAIVAVVLIAVIKPMFKDSVGIGSSQEGVNAPPNTANTTQTNTPTR